MGTPVDPSHARTHALNVEGVFFQQHVAALFRRAGWTITAEEFPVAFPKGSASAIGKEGRLDIRAEKEGDSEWTRTILATECKKADPDYKDWVFFPRSRGSIYASWVVVNDYGPTGGARGAAESERWEVSAVIDVFGHGELCIDARELKAEYGKPDSWKSSTKRIDDACYQAVQASQAIFRDLSERSERLAKKGQDPGASTRIMPLVVTTANLFVCRFDAGKVDTATGTIDAAAVNYDPTGSVIYSYPLPIHLQMETPLSAHLQRRETIETLVKRDVLIVNSQHLETVLKNAPFDAPPSRARRGT